MEKYIQLLHNKSKKELFFFILLNILIVFFETFSVGLVPLFIDFIINPSPILLKYFSFTENLINFEKDKAILIGSIIFVSFFIIKNIFLVSIIAYEAFLTQKYHYYIKRKFLNLYLFAPFQKINSYRTSQIIRNVDTETQNYVSNIFLIVKTSKDITLFITIFLLLIFVDYKSTLIAVLFLSLCLAIYFFGISEYLKKLGTILLENKSLITNWIIQSLFSIKDLKISKKENKILDIFSNRVTNFEIAMKKLKIVQAIPTFVLEIIFVTTAILIIIYLFKSDMNNLLPILALYLVAFIRLLPIFNRFGNTLATLRSFYPSVNHLVGEFEKLKKFTKNYDFEKDKKEKIKFDQEIDIKNLDFKYDNTDKKIINNFNLKISKGEAVAFVGKSGSGKTTLINILSGLLDPTNGTLKIDNVDYKSKILSWQNKVGLISQNPYLIDTTLLNNIIFFNEEEKVNQDRLEFALSYSGLEDFVKSLPQGLETLVGEKGSFLSGGQIQRIALARLLYRDPEVLILDEFTNSLDPENEIFILNQLEKLKKEKKKTLIIISHKIKPLKICEKIVLINEGKVFDTYDYKTFHEKFGVLYD